MTFPVERNPNPRSAEERAAILADPGFGNPFTDHMVRIDYAGGVWGEGAVVPYGPLSLDPATAVLHYGQEIFEGLKAYRQPAGSVAAFPPSANTRALQRTPRAFSDRPGAWRWRTSRRSCSSNRCAHSPRSTPPGCRRTRITRCTSA